MMRIVVDTNVIISALVFGGLPRSIMDLVAQGACRLYFSAPIQAEVERILAEKFGWDHELVHARAGVVFGWGIQVRPVKSLAVIKDDPSDDRILECAVEAEAQAIVSGDRHLLRLGSFQGIRILTPRQFFESQSRLTDNQE